MHGRGDTLNLRAATWIFWGVRIRLAALIR